MFLPPPIAAAAVALVAWVYPGAWSHASSGDDAPPSAKRRVLLVGIDGLRPDALRRSRTPHLDSLWKGGAYTFDGRTGSVPRSGPGWTSLLTGVGLGKHKVTSNNAIAASAVRKWPTLFERFKHHRPKGETMAFVAWTPLADEILTNSGLDVLITGPDRVVEKEAVQSLESFEPELVFVHFNAVDHAGHTAGYNRGRGAYRDAIERTDKRLGSLLAAIDARGDRQEWLVVVVTDHGGKGYDHADGHILNRRIFAIFNGAGVVPGKLTGRRIRLQDITPTVLSWLGHPTSVAAGLDGVKVDSVVSQSAAAKAPKGDVQVTDSQKRAESVAN